MGNNKGFSLIELLVIMAMVAVLGTGLVVSVRIYDSANVRKIAKELNNEIEKARMASMSKSGKNGLKVSVTTDGVLQIQQYNFDKNDVTRQVDVGKNLEVTYCQSSGAAIQAVSAASVSIRFDKTLGSVIEGEGLFMIMRKEKKVGVILYKLTGKHEVVGGEFNEPY